MRPRPGHPARRTSMTQAADAIRGGKTPATHARCEIRARRVQRQFSVHVGAGTYGTFCDTERCLKRARRAAVIDGEPLQQPG